ncbi:Hypothetical predicted protein [Octopus vulgaris]|uniref:Uncharacterized protein n=1 Tax=Octopus vulgaris TaxID=6645 RepID=A0AA36ALB9_OCTVU|nr:Hypothetical predicted protein [Octopus vulgaris]
MAILVFICSMSDRRLFQEVRKLYKDGKKPEDVWEDKGEGEGEEEEEEEKEEEEECGSAMTVMSRNDIQAGNVNSR